MDGGWSRMVLYSDASRGIDSLHVSGGGDLGPTRPSGWFDGGKGVVVLPVAPPTATPREAVGGSGDGGLKANHSFGKPYANPAIRFSNPTNHSVVLGRRSTVGGLVIKKTTATVTRLFAEKVIPKLRHLFPEYSSDDRFWCKPLSQRTKPATLPERN